MLFRMKTEEKAEEPFYFHFAWKHHVVCLIFRSKKSLLRYVYFHPCLLVSFNSGRQSAYYSSPSNAMDIGREIPSRPSSLSYYTTWWLTPTSSISSPNAGSSSQDEHLLVEKNVKKRVNTWKNILPTEHFLFV